MVAQKVTEKDLEKMRRCVAELLAHNNYLFVACDIIEELQDLLRNLHFYLKRKSSKNGQKGKDDKESFFTVPFRKTAKCMPFCQCKIETNLDSIDNYQEDNDLIESEVTDTFWILTSEVERIQNVLDELILCSVEKIESTMHVVGTFLDID